MVSLVLVAHSPQLVAGLREMVAQVAPAVAVEIAAGTGTGRLGTNAPAVGEALGRALACGDGVVVLLDHGSAFLAVDIALDALPASERARVRLSGGPLVEGAILAGIEAAAGGTLEAVGRAADEAWRIPKIPGD
jgi:dihydroxyacetone kinase DhaKLM complex PTS-EIIA-like component DhaM